MKRKGMLCVLLILALTMALAPTAAFAQGVEIEAGASSVAAGDTVFFGVYPQTSNGGGGFNTEPIQWRVLRNTGGELFLLSEKLLDARQYHTSPTSITWENSTIRSWLNGYEGSENQQGVDFSGSGNSFSDVAFSERERMAIRTTTVENPNNPDHGTIGGNNTNDRIFLLSIQEALNATFFPGDPDRIAQVTAYATSRGAVDSGGNGYWWLRSPGFNDFIAAIVHNFGSVFALGGDVDDGSLSVRPAFNIDLSSVIFTSAAVGGKSSATVGSGLMAAEPPGGNLKFTILDTSLELGSVVRTGMTGDTITFSYSGATEGKTLSAVVLDNNGAVTHYGKLVESIEAGGSGSASVSLPGGVSHSTHTVQIFVEECNGDNLTDFASAFTQLNIAPEAALFTVTVIGGTGGGEFAQGDTVHIQAGTPPSGQQFKEWQISPTVTFVSNTSATTPDAEFTMPAQAVTATAVFEQIPPGNHLITVNHTGNGVANASVQSATQGTLITLTATADSGWEFKEWQIISGGITLSSTTTATATFTMPDNAVKVMAVFEEGESEPGNGDNGGDNAVAAADSGIPQTGDEARMEFWLLLLGSSVLMICGLVLLGTVLWRKRRSKSAVQ